MIYESSIYLIALKMTKKQAASVSHSGDCDLDVKALSNVPEIKRQLKKIDKVTLRKELQEYGAWSDEELDDHEQNLIRFLWIAGCDLDERQYMED